MKTAKIIFTFLLLELCSATARAEFVQTDFNTFQLADPQKEVVIVNTTKGIFVAASLSRTSTLAGFDIDQLLSTNVRSVFLAYAPGTQLPEKLVLPSDGKGEAKEFRIRGAFAVTLQDGVRVGYSQSGGSVPYVSVSYSGDGRESIIGFVGRQMLVNLRGARATSMFEAYPLKGKDASVSSPFHLSADNQLFENERAIAAGSVIGMFSPGEHPCLAERATYTWHRGFSVPGSQGAPGAAVSSGAPVSPGVGGQAAATPAPVPSLPPINLSSFLILNLVGDLMYGIHLDSEQFVSIKQNQDHEQQVCVVKPLNFKN